MVGRFFPERPSPKSGLNPKRWNMFSVSGAFPSAVYKIADSDGAKERELRDSGTQIRRLACWFMDAHHLRRSRDDNPIRPTPFAGSHLSRSLRIGWLNR